MVGQTRTESRVGARDTLSNARAAVKDNVHGKGPQDTHSFPGSSPLSAASRRLAAEVKRIYNLLPTHLLAVERKAERCT